MSRVIIKSIYSAYRLISLTLHFILLNERNQPNERRPVLSAFSARAAIMVALGTITLTLPNNAFAVSFPPAGNLTSTYTTTSMTAGNCSVHENFYTWIFTDASNVVHRFPGTSTQTTRIGAGCSAVILTALDTWSSDGVYYLSANGTKGSITALGTVVDPNFKVVSILYATPGNYSSDNFTATTTNGTVTTTGSNFGVGVMDTFSFGWLSGSAGVTWGSSATTGNSHAFQETISNGTSISNASVSTSPNRTSHNQDLLLIMLNPEVLMGETNTGTYVYGTQIQSQNGSVEIPDVIEVTASTMQNNAVNINLLKRQFDVATNQYDLPGLAHVCVDQSQYVNNCPTGGSCGCVAADFAPILAQDPLVNLDTSTNPLSVDTSGASNCYLSVSSGASCRYIAVPEPGYPSLQAYQTLAGPQCQGCNRTVNSFNQSDGTTTTQTLSQSLSESAGYTVRAGGGVGPSLSSSVTFTWTDLESSGQISGVANQIGYSLSSGTTNCNTDVLIYEDTIFHTFVTQLAPGNSSCP